MKDDYAPLAEELSRLLGLSAPPLAIGFSDQRPPRGVPLFEDAMPAASPDGRTGRVSAGCVFWMKGAERTFATVPEDHGNCSVGSLTHGLLSLEDAAEKADLAALVQSGWVTPRMLPTIPTVRRRPDYIVYGPLAESPIEADVVLLRLNGKQVMMLYDAWPRLRFEGKPQCHIIPLAKEQGEIAVSVGCMLSRVRTGMSSNEVTCAIPARRLPALLERLRAATRADRKVAAYAGEDAKRFSR